MIAIIAKLAIVAANNHRGGGAMRLHPCGYLPVSRIIPRQLRWRLPQLLWKP